MTYSKEKQVKSVTPKRVICNRMVKHCLQLLTDKDNLYSRTYSGTMYKNSQICRSKTSSGMFDILWKMYDCTNSKKMRILKMFPVKLLLIGYRDGNMPLDIKI